MDELNELKAITHRLLDLHVRGTTDSAPAPHLHPTWTYTDKQLLDIEKEVLFGQQPLLVCFSSDVAEPGDYYCFDDLDTPVIITRDKQGKVNALVNICTHRAARLKEGCGTSSTISCPYHAWNFGLDGKLQKIYREESFGEINKSEYDLITLPCEEKYGMIYLCLDSNKELNIDKHLGDLAPWFDLWQLQDMQFVNEHVFEMQTNWKLALDTFCEGYHFAPLHKESVGDYALGNISAYDRFGPNQIHHRLAFPNKSILDLQGTDDNKWQQDIFYNFQLVHFLFPNISLLISPAAVEFFQLFPGDNPDQHITRYRCYWRSSLDQPDQGRSPQQHFEFIRDVVADEDYWVSANVQKSLNAGLREFSVFGKNEPALINMHRNFLKSIGLDPDAKKMEATG